ncbi:MAG: hypothetical protein D6704_10130 [Nitrospirae bacterium]|nr:MAG: hypothetical protein D6704_10130 [Nitrospirota bacterium]
MDIQIGPHLYRNTDGTVEIEGVPQLELTLPHPEGPLRVNFVVFDKSGKIPAKLINSTLVINEAGAYTLTKDATRLTLSKTNTGHTLLHVEFHKGDRVVIPQGEFYTLKGHLLKITPLEWSVEKITDKGGETDLKGNPVSLG